MVIRIQGLKRSFHLYGRYLSGACLAGLLIVAQESSAQTASDITPDSFAPPLQRLTGAVVFSGQTGTRAPAGSETIGITLSGVDLTDPLPQMAKANQAFINRLTQGRIPVSELFQATADLEAAYADAGFVLARVVLPQQELGDGGRLRVVVVDGFVGQVDTSKVPANIKPRIDRLTSGLVNKRGLTKAELERQLLLAGDVPGTALKSALAAGQEPGSTIIGLAPEYQKVTGFVGFSNSSSSKLGSLSLDMGVDANSVLGFGETLYARMSGAPQAILSSDPRSRIVAFGAVVPLGYDGTSANLEFTASDTTPDDPAAPTRSDFDRLSLRVIHPFIRGRQFNLSGQVSLDLQRDKQVIVGGATVYEDRLSVLRFGTNLSYLHSDNSFSTAGLILSQGINGLGARSAATAAASGTPLSRAGADADFTKLSGSFSHSRALSDKVSLSAFGRFQTSFGNPLPGSEQMGIVGPSELSAFDGGSLKGDSGLVLRAEISTRLEANFGKVPLRLNPYIFVAGGVAHLAQPTALERAKTSGFAYGIGVDIFTATNSSFRSNSIRIEIGKGERNDSVPDDTRINISGTFRF